MVPSADDSVAERVGVDIWGISIYAVEPCGATAWPPAADEVVIAVLMKAMPPPASGVG
jgi:hypothetical protein